MCFTKQVPFSHELTKAQKQFSLNFIYSSILADKQLSLQKDHFCLARNMPFIWHRIRKLIPSELQFQKDILKAVFVIINRGGGSDLDNSELAGCWSKQWLTSFQRANTRFNITAEISFPVLLGTKDLLISEEYLRLQLRYPMNRFRKRLDVCFMKE